MRMGVVSREKEGVAEVGDGKNAAKSEQRAWVRRGKEEQWAW